MCNRANIVSGALDSNVGFDTAIKREPGTSSEWDLNWGLSRVKYAIVGCNPTLCTPKASAATRILGNCSDIFPWLSIISLF